MHTGRSPARAVPVSVRCRVAGRALAPVLVALLLCGLFLSTLLDAPARGIQATGALSATTTAITTTAARAETPGRPVEVVLDAVSPPAPGPESELRLSGRVINRSGAALPELAVRLRISQTPLDTRGQVAAVADGDETIRPGLPVEAGRTSTGSGLAPGAEARFEVRAPLEALGPRPGGLPYGVHVLGVEALAPQEQQVGLTRTLLPWLPPEARVRPSGVAWLWPLVDVPRRDASGAFSSPAAADELAASLGPGGRLDRLVNLGAGAQIPLTWVVDPMLLDDVQALAERHLVRTGGRGAGGTTRRNGVPGAATWLDRLRRATGGETVQVLPYADIDLRSVAGFGAPDTAAATMRHAQEEGERVAAAILRRPAAADRAGPAAPAALAWPVDGVADSATLATVRDVGFDAVVLHESVLPLDPPPPYTPTGRAQIETAPGKRLEAVLVDDRLSALAAGAPAASATTSPAARVQRFLAETAMLTQERPCCPRTVLVAPPRRYDPDPDYVGTVLRRSGDLPWVKPSTLAQLRAAPPAPLARRGPTSPANGVPAALPPAYLRGLAGLRTTLGAVTEVLPAPVDATTAVDRHLLRLQSSAYRDERARAAADFATARRDVQALRDRLRVLPGSVTLGSRTGQIPVTLANDFDQPVIVRLALTPASPRLTVQQSGQVTVEGRRKAQVLVPAEAVANGLVTVAAQLQTPEGASYGDPVQLRVRVTDVGPVATYLTGGAAVLVFLAGGVRATRRLRRARTGAGQPP